MEALLQAASQTGMAEGHSRARLKEALTRSLDDLRSELRKNGDSASSDLSTHVLSRASILLAKEDQRSLRPVINATGIPLHTNLGRAPLSEAAVAAVARVAAGYSNLEYDLDAGERGRRGEAVEGLLRQLTGAEAALVVNNNAAAVMLAVNTFAAGGEVITSRGELVEIGGSSRIPDVIERSEGDLVEVGTTNRTRAVDFESAITADTRVLLKVHPSNYQIVGFTESASRDELVDLARRHDVTVIEDLGSGSLIDLSEWQLPREPTVKEAVAAGVDVVTFSGDKLLGGPQAGLAVGKSECIDRMRKNPLMRALRADKMTYAALEATLRLYESPDTLAEELPVLRMLTTRPETLRARADRLAEAITSCEALSVTIGEDETYSGGGALPGMTIPTVVVYVRPLNRGCADVAADLRRATPPVIVRVRDDNLVIDFRTVSDDEVASIAASLRESCGCVT